MLPPSKVRLSGIWQYLLVFLCLLGADGFRIGEASHPGPSNAGFDSPDMPWSELEESDTEALYSTVLAQDALVEKVEVTSRVHRSRVSGAAGAGDSGFNDHFVEVNTLCGDRTMGIVVGADDFVDSFFSQDPSI